MRRVCIIGAGFISGTHAEALATLPETRIVAVVDPDPGAARRLARRWKIERLFGSVQDALADGGFDRAHVLVPPPLHRDTALPLLEAGVSVLVEKPLAVSVDECADLVAVSRASGATLAVNQNVVHHQAFLRLRRMVRNQQLGRPNFVSSIFNVPLRQISTRRFEHWMFAAPDNILLELFVHPLSPVAALAGPVQDVTLSAGTPIEIMPGLPFYPTMDLSLACRDLPAQIRFAVGQAFPFWQMTVVCDDGVVVADILANRLVVHQRTKWIDAIDHAASAFRQAGSGVLDGSRNFSEFALSMIGLVGRRDAFFLSHRASIADFHAAVDNGGTPASDGQFGTALVAACEQASRSLPRPMPRRRATPAARTACEIAILGGTGFIGAPVVRRFLEAGQRVSVMARSVENLPTPFTDPAVTLWGGDIRDPEIVTRAISGARIVVNLAHGGASGSFEDIKQAMVGGAELIARTCLAQQVQRLVHIGSMASLYLGPQRERVTGATPPDPNFERRGDYARAKALCDQLLLEMHEKQGLPVCILRPGMVVGAGGIPFHSGLGFYNNEQHCVGWNSGRNPLPFVLVEDVAEAIWLASRADGVDGRCYNLVGDVRMSARDYTAALGRALNRPLRFHPQSSRLLWLQEYAKWLVKRASGRKSPPPALRDILSRGMMANCDCSDAKRDLGWAPVVDPELFLERAIHVHTA